LAKRFGLALGLKEADFSEATQIFECQIHSARTVYNTLLGIPPQNRASALTSESMVCRYSEEFLNAGRKHYGLSDSDLIFFTTHMVADIEHTAQSADLIARLVKTPRDARLVRESAQYMTRIKLGKFDGIYREYA
jgi:pyrroloquinoline quinone (PQQ) biosynthesis protein C